MQQRPTGYLRDVPTPVVQGTPLKLWRPSYFVWGLLFGPILCWVFPFLLWQRRRYTADSLCCVISTLCGSVISAQFLTPLLLWILRLGSGG